MLFIQLAMYLPDAHGSCQPKGKQTTMISSTTQSQPCGTHQLSNAGHNSSITNHQASAGSRSVSVESNTTGTVKHHTNSGSGTGSYVRTTITFVASTALALLNNVSTTVGQNISAFNGTTAFPMNNGTATLPINNGTTAAPTKDCGNPLHQDILFGTSAGLVGFVALAAIACGVKNYMRGSSPETDQESSGSTAGPQAAKNDEALAAQPEKSMV